VKRIIALAALLLLAGCGDRQADEDANLSAADTAESPSPSLSPAAADSLLPGFDPGALKPGDTVQGLRVATMDVNKAFEDSVWVGNIKFAGELEVQGVYQGHFDYPEVRAACFHVTDSASVRRVPRFGPDAHSTRMKTWFCFTNADEAIAQLGPPDQPREATIVIDDFTAVRYFSDAWATGRLVRVTNLGAPSSRSLREVF
jgi:hypothetical protein